MTRRIRFVSWSTHDPDTDIPAGFHADFDRTEMLGDGMYRAPLVPAQTSQRRAKVPKVKP